MGNICCLTKAPVPSQCRPVIGRWSDGNMLLHVSPSGQVRYTDLGYEVNVPSDPTSWSRTPENHISFSTPAIWCCLIHFTRNDFDITVDEDSSDEITVTVNGCDPVILRKSTAFVDEIEEDVNRL